MKIDYKELAEVYNRFYGIFECYSRLTRELQNEITKTGPVSTLHHQLGHAIDTVNALERIIEQQEGFSQRKLHNQIKKLRGE